MNHVDGMMRRYRDAYVVADAVVGIGGAIKIVGVVVAAAISILAFLASGTVGPVVAVVCAGFGLIGGAVICVFGVLIAAQGQMQYAILDVAVNTSPIIPAESKAGLITKSNAASTLPRQSVDRPQQSALDHDVSSKGAAPTREQSSLPRAPWRSPFCYNCGADVPVGTSKCPSCGKEL